VTAEEFRRVGDELDRHTPAWVNAINQSDDAFMNRSKLDEHWMVRLSIGVEATTRAHIEKLWVMLLQRANEANPGR
jgi:aromatic-L-amino-acid/L-tryptophan decarboxylase